MGWSRHVRPADDAKRPMGLHHHYGDTGRRRLKERTAIGVRSFIRPRLPKMLTPRTCDDWLRADPDVAERELAEQDPGGT